MVAGWRTETCPAALLDWVCQWPGRWAWASGRRWTSPDLCAAAREARWGLHCWLKLHMTWWNVSNGSDRQTQLSGNCLKIELTCGWVGVPSTFAATRSWCWRRHCWWEYLQIKYVSIKLVLTVTPGGKISTTWKLNLESRIKHVWLCLFSFYGRSERTKVSPFNKYSKSLMCVLPQYFIKGLNVEVDLGVCREF